MNNNVTLPRSLGVLRIPDASLVDITEINRFGPGEICVISTGSQGEPRSALALMASESSKWLAIGPSDTVILSSHPIPGNENDVSRVLNGLVKLDAEVVHSGLHDVHATGHPRQEKLKTLLDVLNPEWFVPVHGEYRHLAANARLAQSTGISAERTVVCEDGNQIPLDDRGVRRSGTVPAGHLYVDGILDDLGSAVLHTDDTVTADTLQRTIRRATGQFVDQRTRRRPMIVPVVVET
jgi:ribonuclease J